jgi:hypothetical protein
MGFWDKANISTKSASATKFFFRKPLFYLIILVLIVGTFTVSSQLVSLKSKPRIASAASTSCDHPGTWQADPPAYDHRRGAGNYVPITNTQYFESLTLTDADVVFKNPDAKIVVRNGLSVDASSTIWGAWAFDRSVSGNGTYGYVGDVVDIDIEVCGGNLDLEGKINNDGANNWRRTGTTGHSASLFGQLKTPKLRDGGIQSSEENGEGGGGAHFWGGSNNYLYGGSGGGGNGGYGGSGSAYILDNDSASAGGGGAGIFANGGSANSSGGRIRNSALIGTIAKNLNYLTPDQKDQPELYLTTFGGRGGVPDMFYNSDDGSFQGWWSLPEPGDKSGVYTKSAGGGFIKIILRDGNGALNLSGAASISSKGTEGQTVYMNGAHWLVPSTGGGAGGTIYIKANFISLGATSPSKIDVSGGSASIVFEAYNYWTDVRLAPSGGGGGGIIYLDITNSSSISGYNSSTSQLSIQGGTARFSGAEGYILWGYDMTSGGGFAQVEKRTYKDSCTGAETATFNSGDTVCVKLLVPSASGVSSATITDEIPSGAVPIPNPPPGSTFSGTTITWTNQTLPIIGNGIQYSFKMP